MKTTIKFYALLVGVALFAFIVGVSLGSYYSPGRQTNKDIEDSIYMLRNTQFFGLGYNRCATLPIYNGDILMHYKLEVCEDNQ